MFELRKKPYLCPNCNEVLRGVTNVELSFDTYGFLKTFSVGLLLGATLVFALHGSWWGILSAAFLMALITFVARLRLRRG